jgi:predicted ester cyclase
MPAGHAARAARAAERARLGALAERLVEEACNQGRLEVLDELLAPAHRAGGPPLRAHLAAFRAAVPDARWTIVEQVVQGNTVAARLAVRGTFWGPLLGLAPPGRPAVLTGVAIGHVAGGRLVELWLQADLLGLMQQLGVLPPLDLAQAVAMAQVQRTGALLDNPVGQKNGWNVDLSGVCATLKTRSEKCTRREEGTI